MPQYKPVKLYYTAVTMTMGQKKSTFLQQNQLGPLLSSFIRLAPAQSRPANTRHLWQVLIGST